MKYLVLGPACMGIFSMIGRLKAMESDLVDVKEISGSSAGSILALFLAVGMSMDEIYEIALSTNIADFFKIKLSSFSPSSGLSICTPYVRSWSRSVDPIRRSPRSR
jgi:NTE family protein